MRFLKMIARLSVVYSFTPVLLWRSVALQYESGYQYSVLALFSTSGRATRTRHDLFRAGMLRVWVDLFTYVVCSNRFKSRQGIAERLKCSSLPQTRALAEGEYNTNISS